MKKIFGWVVLLVDMVTGASAQVNDTAQRATGNDLYQGITQKLPYWQMVMPHEVQMTFAKTVRITFPSATRYVDLGSNWIVTGRVDGAKNVIRVKAATEGFPRETNFSVICEDGSFYSFSARYAHEPEVLNIEIKGFLEDGDTTNFSHTRMNIHFHELAGGSPLSVKLIMQGIYKEDGREVRHLGCEHFGVQFLLKSAYSYDGLFYFHTETRNRSDMTFRTDSIRFKIVDKKVPKRAAIQERMIDPVRSHNEVLVTEGKNDVRTVYAVLQLTMPNGKLLAIDLSEKDGGGHQTIRVEDADFVAAGRANELRIK